MSEYKILHFNESDQDKVHAFLQKEYPRRGDFMEQHGDWLYRGNKWRWVVMNEETDEVMGHLGTLPVHILLNGEPRESCWGIDLVVGHGFRNRKLYWAIDYGLRYNTPLYLAYPNKATRLLTKQTKWLQRDSGFRFAIPLSPWAVGYMLHAKAGARRPRNMRRVSKRKKFRYRIEDKLTSIAAGGAAWPFTRLARVYLARYRAKGAYQLDDPSATFLADVFMRHNLHGSILTNYRDEAYIQWRFLDSPMADEMRYYAAGPADAPTHILIARTAPYRGHQVTRILDMFGDLDNMDGMMDALRLAMHDAVRAKTEMITTIATLPAIDAMLRQAHFIDYDDLIFACISRDKSLMEAVHAAELAHWTFSDCDFDFTLV
jgi:hypothetical protein